MMRRFMWQLNDECGGIGWGIPEVMGEVMARNEGLAMEFAPILVSYIRKDGNYLEFEPLQRGALWAMGRLGLVRPQLLQGLGATSHVLPFLNSPDAAVRGLAAWVSGLLEATEAETDLKGLANDLTPVRVFLNGEIFRLRIADLAKESLYRIRNKTPRFYPG